MSLLDSLLSGLGDATRTQPSRQPVNPLLQILLGLLAAPGGRAAGGGAGAGGLGDLLAGLAGGAAGGRGGAGGAGGLGDLLAELTGGAGRAADRGGPGGAGGLGGLGGLIEAFRRAGLDDHMQSWVGTGRNLPISPDQLEQVFGREGMGRLAERTGMSRDQLSGGLADLLPEAIDRLTPGGQAPDTGFGDVFEVMERLGRRS
jgi:uncharacterized protein YidB (DUF937 family)